MHGIISGAVMASLLATVIVVSTGNEEDSLRAIKAGAAHASAVPVEAYRLQFAGDATSCTVEKGTLLADGGAELSLNQECTARYPRLAGISRWQEREDGTVAFKRDDGTVVVEFSVSDGAAYESFQPGSPLLSLMAL